MNGTTIENLVIGGGPAGAMVALRLAEAGRAVVLLEKESGPHPKVCGEFLSREAVQYLESAGIDLRALGALAIERVRLHAGRRTAETRLPFRAMSLSRQTLDEAMLVAAGKGGEVRRGVEVEGLTRDRDQWRVAVRGDEPLWARTVFLATGKHEVRGWSRSGGAQADLVGFKMHWRLRTEQRDALRGAMELFLFRGGYGGMSLVEGDAATLCFVIRRSKLQKIGGRWGALQEIKAACSSLGERLAGAEALYEKPLAISPIPYGYMAREDRGVWCVGDQAAVIPSFTGDGMSIALHSAALAVEMALAGKSIAEFNRTLRGQLRPGMRLATLLSRTMVTAPGRSIAPVAFAVIPRGLRWIAAATRIPEKALVARGQA
jgi:menaquinone-9 beta-reductase